MSGDTSSPSLGQDLLDAGWHQGTIFTARSVYFLWNETPGSPGEGQTAIGSRRVKPKEKLVLVTQDCDIITDETREPYVEALICRVDRRRDFLERIDRNSARWFVVDPESGLVALATYRVQIAKRVLAGLSPGPWPGGPKRLQRFIRWLSRRYDRPAVPDPLVEAFQRPFEEMLERIHDESPSVGAAFNRAVSEVRVSVPPNETPPFDLHVVLMLGSDTLTREEADAIDHVERAVLGRFGSGDARVGTGGVYARTEDEMSVAEYFATRPLFLEYLTYRGDAVEGAEPPPRV